MAKKAARKKPAILKEAAEEVQHLVSTSGTDIPEEPKAWEMPEIGRGQPVVFYYRCTVSEKNADIGFVATVGKSSIGISYRNQGYDECYHKDDPRLVVNPDLKHDIGGVWDFTKEKMRSDARLDAIEQRIKTLEG